MAGHQLMQEMQVESMREATFDLLKTMGIVSGGLAFQVDKKQVEEIATQEYFEQFSIYNWTDTIIDEVMTIANRQK